MARNQDRRRKSQERRAKRRQQEQRRRQRTEAPPGSRENRLALAARHPLYDCRIATSQDALVHHVLVARETPAGITSAWFLVDTGCRGVRDCVVHEGRSPAEFEQLLTAAARRGPVETVSLACAARLLEESVRWAASLGLRPHPDYAAARALLGEADPDECTRAFPLGVEGKPFYDPGVEENVGEVLRRLEERLGPRGFHYLLLPEGMERTPEGSDPASEPSADGPSPAPDTEPTAAASAEARAWQSVRRTEARVRRALQKLAGVRFGERFDARAPALFAGDGNPELFLRVEGTLVLDWALTRLAGVPYGRPARAEEERTAAALLLEENGPRLSERERELVEQLLERPFGFHVVREVRADGTLRLTDLFLGRELVVHEPALATGIVAGTVLYARVVTFDGCAVLAGFARHHLPPTARLPLLTVRDHLRRSRDELEERMLLALEDELRSFFCSLLDRLFHPPQAGPAGAATGPEQAEEQGQQQGEERGPPSGTAAASLEERAAAHWRAWLERPTPALGDVSPLVAAASEAGRERLEVLLDDLAYVADPEGDPFAPDVDALRATLGLLAPVTAAEPQGG